MTNSSLCNGVGATYQVARMPQNNAVTLVDIKRIVMPSCRILNNVLADVVKRSFIADNVLVKAPLPYGLFRLFSKRLAPNRNGTFELANYYANEAEREMLAENRFSRIDCAAPSTGSASNLKMIP